VPRLARLDAELVRRGLARSREHAGRLIADGLVSVGGTVARKAATGVGTDAAVLVAESVGPEWASRGSHKLLGALAAFGPSGLRVEGRRCLDAGASTGGFTDVLLRHGAREVSAVDVGYGQLVWRLRTDERVRVYDRTNVRTLTPDAIGGPADLIVADLSFISLRLVLPALMACAADGADLVPMVKPQFEVGRERLGAGGVVRERAQRVEAVLHVVREARRLGWDLRGAVASPLPGPSGNVEYFVWLGRGDLGPASAAPAGPAGAGDGGAGDGLRGYEVELVERAVEEGPA
jgi:23S rRNA (cytidine1920-2'-O)/16S rRNA (cytidine1409-2'-O)-methyltransferase